MNKIPLPIKNKDVKIQRNKIEAYSLIKIKENKPPPYSVLNPETNSDSPSEKSKGDRLDSAKQINNQQINKGNLIRVNQYPNCQNLIFSSK